MKTKKIIVIALIICTIALIMGSCKKEDDGYDFDSDPYYEIIAPKYTKYAVGCDLPIKDHRFDLQDFNVWFRNEFGITDRCLLLWPDGAALNYYSTISSEYRGTQSISIFYRTDFIGSFNVSVFTPDDLKGKWRRSGGGNVVMEISNKNIDITDNEDHSNDKAFVVDTWEARRDESYVYNDSSNYVGFYGNKSTNENSTFIILSGNVGDFALLYEDQIWFRQN